MTRQQYDMNENFKKLKIKLVKVSTVGLFALGLGVMVASNTGDKFEYNQDSITTLSDQYQHHVDNKLGVETKDILDMLSSYEIAYDNYKEGKGDEVELRKELISQTAKLEDAAYEMIKLKAIGSVGCDSNASLSVDDLFNKEDGPQYELVLTDNNNSYRLKIKENTVFNIINNIDVLNSYAGNGEHEVWASAIKGYSATAEKVYYDVLKLAAMDNVNFKIAETSKRIKP